MPVCHLLSDGRQMLLGDSAPVDEWLGKLRFLHANSAAVQVVGFSTGDRQHVIFTSVSLSAHTIITFAYLPLALIDNYEVNPAYDASAISSRATSIVTSADHSTSDHCRSI